MVLKRELDNLLERGVLSAPEYAEFFQTMEVAEDGRLVGLCPNTHAQHKYDIEGDLWDESLLDFVLKEIVFPIGIERYDEVFSTYGKMIYTDQEHWVWWTRDNIPEEAIEQGCKPIEDATEEELWKMVAIASRYWEILYKRRWWRLRTAQEAT